MLALNWMKEWKSQKIKLINCKKLRISNNKFWKKLEKKIPNYHKMCKISKIKFSIIMNHK